MYELYGVGGFTDPRILPLDQPLPNRLLPLLPPD